MNYARLLLVPAALFCSTAHGQSGDVSAQRFGPTTDGLGILDVEGARVLPVGTFAASIWAHYANHPLTVHGDGEPSDAVTHRYDLDLGGAWAPFDWAQIGLATRVTALQSRSSGSQPLGDLEVPARAGLGALRLLPRARLLRGPVAVAVMPELRLPVATGAYLGDASVVFAPRLSAGRTWGRVRALVNVGYELRSAARAGDLELDDQFTYGLGVSALVGPAWRPLRLDLALSGATAATDPFGDAARSPLEILAGLGVDLRPGVALSLGGGAGLVGRLGTADVRIFLGMTAALPTPVTPPSAPIENDDSDGDGVPNDVDGAPFEPEDLDGYEDHDGIPDPTADRADTKTAAAEAQPTTDTRTDPRPSLAGAVADADADADADGRADNEDDCPSEPEDEDTFEDEDGCPDPDNDGDNKLDGADACPNVWSSTDDGCPATASITDGRVTISNAIRFELGRARISSESRGILGQIAQLLLAHPEVRKLRIEGHTDDAGPAAKNLRLSRARARAVRTALIELGVESERLVAKGFGESEPVADNSTDSGRENNRRVVFVIISTQEANP